MAGSTQAKLQRDRAQARVGECDGRRISGGDHASRSSNGPGCRQEGTLTEDQTILSRTTTSSVTLSVECIVDGCSPAQFNRGSVTSLFHACSDIRCEFNYTNV